MIAKDTVDGSAIVRLVAIGVTVLVTASVMVSGAALAQDGDCRFQGRSYGVDQDPTQDQSGVDNVQEQDQAIDLVLN